MNCAATCIWFVPYVREDVHVCASICMRACISLYTTDNGQAHHSYVPVFLWLLACIEELLSLAPCQRDVPSVSGSRDEPAAAAYVHSVW